LKLDCSTRPAFDPAGERDIVFIPVGINYDRTFEDRSQVLALDGKSPRPGIAFAASKSLSFAFRNFYLMAIGQWYRFGYACVNFGSPVSMRSFCRDRGVSPPSLDREDRFREVAVLADALMDAVGKVIPVLPVSLLATVLLRRPDARWDELELKAEAARLIRELSDAGAHVYIPRKDRIRRDRGAARLLLAGSSPGGRAVRGGRKRIPLLRYYANAVRHLLPGP
jgi:glycerol-3-phosphate O-acyltransferase